MTHKLKVKNKYMLNCRIHRHFSCKKRKLIKIHVSEKTEVFLLKTDQIRQNIVLHRAGSPFARRAQREIRRIGQTHQLPIPFPLPFGSFRRVLKFIQQAGLDYDLQRIIAGPRGTRNSPFLSQPFLRGLE